MALLEGKVCVVTGGSQGIGKEIVATFVREGARVFSLSRSENADLRALGVVQLPCDVASEESITAAFNAIYGQVEKVDVLVNNAGITKDQLIFRMPTADWEAVLNVNLTSAFLTSKIVANKMIKQRSGSIINVSSIVGVTGNAGQTNYAASKAGLIGFSKALAQEVAGRGVRVNVVAPGYIETPMTHDLPDAAKQHFLARIPLARAGTPEEVAKAALFLASDLSSYVTGEVLKVTGGLGM